jgi:hypothetical protein
MVSDKILEEEGVLGDVSIAELSLYFLPLESDVLSLELDDAFSDLYLVSLDAKLLLLDCIYYS